MWHRAVGHEKLPEQADNPQNYFLLYRPLNLGDFEIVRICSIKQIASMWVEMHDLSLP